MRYSAQHKAKTHERVLKKAAEQMRRRGVQGTGIAGLMGKVGLTHGGFYAHFPDKNALIAEATGPMLEEGVAGDIAAAEAAAATALVQMEEPGGIFADGQLAIVLRHAAEQGIHGVVHFETD